MADYEIVANAIESQHIRNLLKSDKRIDGRTLDQFREVKIETNVVEKANGSAIVHLGKTKVICGVKAEIGTPWPDYPNRGSLNVTLEQSPLSAPNYRNGPPSDDAIELSRVTDRLIRESEVIDLEGLCIIDGSKAWVLHIDLYTLDDFGNMFDAAGIAALAALATTKIPEVKVLDDGSLEFLETTKKLELKSFPISVTTYRIGEKYLVDADLKEEQIADARITLGTTETHIVSGQLGRGSIKRDKMMETLKTSIKVAADIRKAIRSQIEELA